MPTTQDLYNPAYLKSLCAKYGLTPSKEYGQNYLITDKPVREMVAAANLTASDTVVEIGPGFGALTQHLVETAGTIIAFEIEKKLQPYWEEQEEEHKNLTVEWGNVLKEFPKKQHTLPETYSVLANLPYQITSFALRTLLEAEHPPTQIIVMVQKEVADRICAKPGDMSTLAVAVQYYGTPKKVYNVKKGAFWPSPKVDSAIIRIGDITKQENAEQFFIYVKAGFANKRKQLWKNLAAITQKTSEEIKQHIKDVCGNEKIRAEDLSVEQWKTLVTRLSTE